MEFSRRSFSLGRDRALRRVVSDEFEQIGSTLKASKIPPGFVNFDNIESLRPRELAYTAHIAHRVGMENENLWERIHGAFMESLDFQTMKPKFLTQCVVALSARPNGGVLSDCDIQLVIQTVGKRVREFRPIDLVLLLHSLSDRARLNSGRISRITDHLATCDLSQMSPKSIAVLLASVGKLRVPDCERLLRNCIPIVVASKELFNQYEVAGIIRSFSVLSRDAIGLDKEVDSLTNTLLSATDMSQLAAGCINIILHALAVLQTQKTITVNEVTIHRLFSQLSSCLLTADANLIPHLLLGVAQLVSRHGKEQELILPLRLASGINRQYTQFKAVALPVAVKALEILHEKFPRNADFKVLLTSLSATSVRVIEQYLVLASEDERRNLLHSKYCRFSSWLRDRVIASLPEAAGPVQASSIEAIIERIHLGDLVSFRNCGEFQTQVIEAMDSKTAAMTLWLLFPSSDSGIEGALLAKATREEAGLDDFSFSLLFRYMLKAQVCASVKESVLSEFISLAVGDRCEVRSLVRALEVALGNNSAAVHALRLKLVQRISEVPTNDLLPVLNLLNRSGVRFDDPTSPESVFLDFVEAKLAVHIELVKSVSKREALQAAAKNIGLAVPSDVMEMYENELAQNRRSTQFCNSQ